VSIVVRDDADEVVTFAASELGSYLQKMSGEKIPKTTERATHRIYLGHVPTGLPAGARAQLQNALDCLQADGFIVRSVGRDIVIVGKGSRGTLYGSYAYLEHLGARWYFPGQDYEVIPRARVDWGKSVDISESPTFPKRILFYWPHHYTRIEDWIDFSAKTRLNRIAFHYTWPARDWYIGLRPRILPELKKRGLEIEVAGHFLSSFLPRTLFKDHPEWFRLNQNGQRTNDFNLNPFSAEAMDYLASGVVKQFSQMPEANLIHLWADDIEGGGWSHEPGKEDYTASDQALLVTNHLVRRLRESLPKANLAFLAYHDTVFPPRIVKPEPGVIYLYAPRERCYGHALDDALCPLNVKYARALEQALPSFGSANAEVFEYYVDQILYENLTNPPLPDVMSVDARYFQSLGIPAVGALMTNTSEFFTPMANMFLYPRALWDSKRDLQKDLDEYAAQFFGDRNLGAYFLELGRGLKDVLKVCQYEHPGVAWDWVRVDRESDEALESHVQGLMDGTRGPLARASSLLDEALRKSRNSTHKRRLQGERDSLDFTLLQTRLYYHLLKGEQLYRRWKRDNDPEAGLGLLTESALARYTWEWQRRSVGKAGMKGSPLIPDVRSVEERARELVNVVYRDPGMVAGVNHWGYGVDPVVQHWEDGVSGIVLSGPAGSSAVLWSDVPGSHAAFDPARGGLLWQDEFGRPVDPASVNLNVAPTVILARGMSADQLFTAVQKSQRKRQTSSGR
jgi:hypothetical protein